MVYVPNNLYVFCAAMVGAHAGLLANSTPLSVSHTYSGYVDTNPIAAAYAEALDTAWASATNPTIYEKDEIEDLSLLYFSKFNPGNNPATDETDPDTYTLLATQILAIVQAGDEELTALGITSPTVGTGSVTRVTGTAPIVITGVATVTPNVTITAATDGAAGSMSAADKTKLDEIATVLPNHVADTNAAILGAAAPATFSNPVGLTLSLAGVGKSHFSAALQVDIGGGSTSLAGEAVQFTLYKSVNGGAFGLIAGSPLATAEISATQGVCAATLVWDDVNTPTQTIRYQIQATNLINGAHTLRVAANAASITAAETL